MGCVASRVDQKFSAKKQSARRLRKSTLYAEKLKENSFPARIPQRCTCRMAIMKEMGKELRREKGKQLVNFDYQNVNSLCSRHQRALVLCLHQVIQTQFLTNQRPCFLKTVF